MTNLINLSEYRGLVAISGTDKEKFLQGIISNDVKKISSTALTFAFLLTPQGKYIFDLLIFEYNERYYIDCEKPRVEELIKKLSQYKLRSKITVENASEDFIIAQNIAGDFANNEALSFVDRRNSNLGKRLYIAKANADNFELDNSEAALNSYKKSRILNLVPEGIIENGGEFTVDETYPMQFHMIENEGVDFKKGCYVGQEVTARTHHRGTIRKSIFSGKIIAENAANIEVGGEIYVGTVKIGSLISKIDDLAMIHAEIDAVKNTAENNLEIKIGNNEGNACLKLDFPLESA